MEKYAVAIDGPSGSGKSTIAKIVANKIGAVHINTGNIYRAYAYAATSAGIDVFNKGLVEEFSKACDVEIDINDGVQINFVNGEKVENELRTEEVGMAASKVSSYPVVRECVNQKIRDLASRFSVVMDGRDIGSVVFPNTKHKFYLDASSEVRARRRCLELGDAKSYDEVLADIIKRDKQDSTREIAPLTRCDDAIYIDSSNMSVDEVSKLIIERILKK